MTLLKFDKPGTYEVGDIIAGTIPRADQVIEVTAPDVTIIGLNGSGLRRAASDPQGDGDWSAFVRVRSTAARCTIRNSVLDNNDVISVHVAAPNFVLEDSSITRMGLGVMFDGASAKSGRIISSAIHKADRMMRSTVGGSDDTGAMCVSVKGTPRVSDPLQRNRIIGSYLGDAIVWSPDYGWKEGAGVEVYQACSLEVIDSVLIDCAVAQEGGSKSVQVSDIHWINNYVGALEISNDEKLRTGLGFRPVADSRVTGNKFFDLDYWDVCIGWPSGTYAYGTNSNFVLSGNSHACTRNSKAYAYGGAGGSGYTVDPNEIVLYGGAAIELAAQHRTAAVARRDMILAGAGLVSSVPPPTDYSVAIKALQDRMDKVEADLKAEALARKSADTALDARLDSIGVASQG